VRDPESGQQPSDAGAFVNAGHAEPSGSEQGQGRSRRSKNRKRRPSQEHSGQDGPKERQTPVQSLDGAEPPPHKRKKRRRSRGKKPSGARPETADALAVTTALQPVPGQGPSGKNRKKNRHKRGLQGRPLMPAHTPVAMNGPAASPPPEAREMASATQASRGAAGHGARPAQTASYPNHLYAALDLGTNNCRLLIAQPGRPGQFRVVDAFSRIVRLGEGLAASGRLSEDAMDRAVDALRICAGKLAAKQIRKMRLIATEACRSAANGVEFLERVKREAGLELEIINRETEARLAVSGCASLVERDARSVVLFDIGGGSSEIAVINVTDRRSTRLANHITHWTSLPVGVVTLSEKHGGRDVTPEVFGAMVDEVEGMLSRFECPPPVGGHDAVDYHLIGTSGTVTTLAGVHLDLPRYDRRRVDGLWMHDDDVTAMQARLLSWNFDARASNPCIGPDRADLVLAGCAILEAIRRRWPSKRMRVADRGLREGLLTDMMADDGAWRRHRNKRFNTPRNGGRQG
jgi:exopolyphosphatase / guanosine-5'-triphosphate,3'-diphosphate pyrophosphatase